MDREQIIQETDNRKTLVSKKITMYQTQRSENDVMIKLLQRENEQLSELILLTQREYGEIDGYARKLFDTNK